MPRPNRFTLWQQPVQKSCGAPVMTLRPLKGCRIVPRSPVPLVADIHFQYRLALAALDAGVACLRLNPGNIRKAEHIRVVAEARDRGVPIRIGVNADHSTLKLKKSLVSPRCAC